MKSRRSAKERALNASKAVTSPSPAFSATLNSTPKAGGCSTQFPSEACVVEVPAQIARKNIRYLSLRPLGRTTKGMDKLEEIFRMQAALNVRIGVLPPANDEEKAKWILNYTRALQQETAELIDSVPWKWWAKYQKFDEQNAKVEVVDLFHFLVSLAQTLGLSAEDVYQAYLKKNAVNHQRQDSGYVKKDADDSKHI